MKTRSLLKLFSGVTQAPSITPGIWSMLDKYFFEYTKYSIKHNRGDASKMNEEIKG